MTSGEKEGLTPSEPSSIDVCECGHLRATHGYGPRCIGNRNLCGCMGFQARKKPECQHPDKQYVGGLYDGPGGRKSYIYYSCPDCKAHWKEEERKAEPEPSTKGDFLRCQCTHFQMNHRPFTEGGCRNCACDCFKLPAQAPEAHDFVSPAHCGACMASWTDGAKPLEDEPPLTPEEEEEAPQDCGCDDPFDLSVTHRADGPCFVTEGPPCSDSGGCTCGVAGDAFSPTGHYLDCPVASAGDARCVHGGDHAWGACGGDPTPPPPQPERRPPLLVAYSVQGHLYEVALPGDATVKAVDGALVIQHALGPVAGIVQVLPVVNKEQG